MHLAKSQSHDLGREADAVRRSQALPLTWNVPSPDETKRLLKSLSRYCDTRRAVKRPDVEAAVLILLTLQTGREQEELLQLTHRRIDTLSIDELSRSGVAFDGKSGFIILPARAAKPPPEHSCKYKPVLNSIVLPQCDLLRRALTKLEPSDESSQPIFRSDADTIAPHVRRLLRGDNAWRLHTVKATRSLAAQRRWLQHRLRIIPGGDPALHAVMAAKLTGAERTVSHYATINTSLHWTSYREALKPIDPRLPVSPPEWMRPLHYGSPSCPDSGALETALDNLRQKSQLPISNGRGMTDRLLGATPFCRHRHLAMMSYTFALATFSTGQRSIGRLARLDDIDPESGFAWVVEKSNPAGGYGGSRGVFHHRATIAMLADYEAYLNTIESILQREAPDCAEALRSLRAEPGVAFFDIQKGRVVRLTSAALMGAAGALGWPFAPGAGRHWLRSEMIGRVPSDALAAQFGHHLDGLDVWNTFSGLDPQQTALHLNIGIGAALKPIKRHWQPISKRRYSRSSAQTPNFSELPDYREARAGQLLASAIWNGALLAPQDEKQVLEIFSAHSQSEQSWYDLGRIDGAGQRRWFIDAATSELMGRLRARRITGLRCKPDQALDQFLGHDGMADGFRKRACLRWRFRIPPIIYSHARGELSSTGLAAESFDPSSPRARIPPSEELQRSAEPSLSGRGDDFAAFIQDHWNAASYKTRTGCHRTPRCKGITYRRVTAAIGQQQFFQKMTPAEQNIAQGLIETLRHASKCSRSPAGASGSTIIKRIERIWGQMFQGRNEQELRMLRIEGLTQSFLTTFLGLSQRDARQICEDLRVIIEALGNKDDVVRPRAELIDMRENRTAWLIHPHEYGKALHNAESARSWHDRMAVQTATALCYRTGLRFDELKHIETKRIIFDDNGPKAIWLDHIPDSPTGIERLKTFHSRRRIPVDLLLTKSERALFAQLLNCSTDEDRPFRRFHSVPDSCPVREGLKSATGQYAPKVYALRHSFATNALAAFLWPRGLKCRSLERFFDPATLANASAVRRELCGPQSLGAAAPYAVAIVLGHTSPSRTLFSYAHHFEVLLAAYVLDRANQTKVIRGGVSQRH